MVCLRWNGALEAAEIVDRETAAGRLAGTSAAVSKAVRSHLKDDLSALAIFDPFTKPSIELKKPEREKVKQLAKALLDKLKAEKLVLDWRKKARRMAAVRTCIYDTLDAMPDRYSHDLYEKKRRRIYEHVYGSYWGDGAGKLREELRELRVTE